MIDLFETLDGVFVYHPAEIAGVWYGVNIFSIMTGEGIEHMRLEPGS